MFETIVVPTDGSKFAQKAEDMAISIANKYDAKIVGAYVIDDKLIYPYEVLEEEGKSILKNLSDKAKEKGVIVDEILVVGNPAKDLVTIIRRMDPDIVVIGTHGKKGLEKLLMGSVAENILKTVEKPVLLVK
ncbi:MAG: universal stress protein [Methanobacterium sp.]|uniref:universal stress protein n=1 Tax=Methanobacterium sp. TaxID=2164 RepID=UPI003D64B1BC|nr:universal stress protein [Methanobacterium sp.]